MEQGLAQTMKRALSIEFNEEATASASSNAKRFAPNNNVIVIPPETNPNLNPDLASLIEIFPETEPSYLSNQLQIFNYNLNVTIDHIFNNPGPQRAAGSARTNNIIVNSKQTPHPESDEEIEVLESDLEPTVEPNDREDLRFIQSLFPDLKSSAALKVIREVKRNNSIRPDQRKQHYADVIINKGYNEKYAKKKKEPVIQAEQASTSQAASNLTEKEMYDMDFESIQSVVNDCAPDYIHEQLRKQGKNARRVELIINEMLEKKSYPRLRDYMNQMKKKQDLDAHLNMNIDFEEFIKMYPEPSEHFYDKKKDMSENYKNHCRTLLYNNFIMIARDSLDSVLSQHNWHLTPSVRQLEDAYPAKKQNELRERIESARRVQHSGRRPAPLKFSRKGKYYKLELENRAFQAYPDSLDEHFFRECFFLKHEREIIDYIKKKKDNRKKKLEEGKRNNSLKECGCCFSNELLEEDLLPCTLTHQFCRECVKSYIETNIGNCKYQFVCLEGSCEGEFDMSVVQEVLSANMMSAYIRNKQNEEIKKANITNLETCPFCVYAEIIENPDEKVFYCKNPDCLKETCRKCNEPNHLPLRCDEIEKKQQVDMRTWIENRVTESMIRVCYKCGQRFYKVEGCNMMHCVCGASMCYLCREPIKDYSHFAKADGCKQNTDTNEVHQKEMEEAYKKATEEYLKLHPEAKDIELKYDPKKLLDAESKKSKASAAAVRPPIPVQQYPHQAPRPFQPMFGIPMGLPIMADATIMMRNLMNDQEMNRLMEIRANQAAYAQDHDDDDDSDSDLDGDSDLNDNDSDEQDDYY